MSAIIGLGLNGLYYVKSLTRGDSVPFFAQIGNWKYGVIGIPLVWLSLTFLTSCLFGLRMTRAEMLVFCGCLAISSLVNLLLYAHGGLMFA